MNPIKQQVIKLTQQALEHLVKIKISFSEIEEMIIIPQNTKFGDYSLPCFKLAKEFNMLPKQLAYQLAKQINEWLKSTNFINI